MAAATAVGVTGDVGAGKSTVARLMEAAGGVRLDADAIALGLWRREDVRGAAVARWGRGILGAGGEVVRSAVAERIFSDPVKHRWCCALLHPLVMEELRRRVAELDPPRWAVVEIPLLYEAGRPDWLNSVVFVTAPWDVRVERCRAQRGWDEAELRRREGYFLPSRERMNKSDFVISNAGDSEELVHQIDQVIEWMREGRFFDDRSER